MIPSPAYAPGFSWYGYVVNVPLYLQVDAEYLVISRYSYESSESVDRFKIGSVSAVVESRQAQPFLVVKEVSAVRERVHAYKFNNWTDAEKARDYINGIQPRITLTVPEMV